MLALGWYEATRHPEAPYRGLSSAPPNDAANALVVFRPDASEAQIRQALRGAGARLVGGPTATDAYLIQFGVPASSALARLRTDAAVMRVESLDGGAGR